MEIWRCLEVSQSLTAAGQGFLPLGCGEASGTPWPVQIHRDKQPLKLSSPFFLGNHQGKEINLRLNPKDGVTSCYSGCAHTCRTFLCPLPPTLIPPFPSSWAAHLPAHFCLWPLRAVEAKFRASVSLDMEAGCWYLSLKAMLWVGTNINQNIFLFIRICV